MTRIRFAAVLLFFLSIPVHSQNISGSIEGTVVRYGTREPLANAQVLIGKPAIPEGLGLPLPELLLRVIGNWVAPGTASVTVTDREGRFAFSNLQAGDYIVVAGGDDYAREGYAQRDTRTIPDFARHIPLRSGEDSREIVLSLLPLARVKGVVRGSDGKPLAGLNVSAGHIEYNDGHPEWQRHGNSVKTNDQGEYQLVRLRSGKYYIAAAFDHTEEDPSLRGAYYPRALSPAFATTVSLIDASDITADVEVQARPDAIKTVSGKIKGVLPPDASPAGATLVPRGSDVVLNSPVCLVRGAEVNTSGEFHIKGVQPGSYELYVSAFGSGRTYLGTVPVVVGDRDITGLEVAFDKATVDVTVQASANGKLPSSGVVLIARMETLRLSDYCSSDEDLRTRVDLKNQVLFKRVLPGTYDLVIRPDSEGEYLEDIRQAGHSIFDSGLVIKDMPPPPIEVILRQGGGAVRVRTLGERTRKGTLLLVPDPLHKNQTLYREINTRGSSSFTFENVRPGRYKVFAIEGVLNGSELSPEYFTMFPGKGVSITVRDGETVSAQVNLMSK